MFGARSVSIAARVELFEAVGQLERVGVEQRELLLDREREVGAVVERRTRLREELLPGDALLLAHRGSVAARVRPAEGAAGRRSPRPALDDGLARRAAQLVVVGGRRARGSPFSLRGEVARRRRSRTTRGRGSAPGSASSSPAATSARPEWRATSGGEPAAAASAATIPNASGKIDGTTVDVGERQQMHEVAMLERAGEERALGGASASSVRAVRAEADDDEPRVERRASPRAAPARPSARSASRSRRRSARRRRGTPRAARRCPRPAGAPRRCPGSAGRARASVEQRRRARRRDPASTNSSTSTPGGTSTHALDVADDVLEHVAGCARSRRRSPRPARATRAPTRSSSGRPRIEYSSSEPCALTRNGTPGRRADRRRRAARGS